MHIIPNAPLDSALILEHAFNIAGPHEALCIITDGVARIEWYIAATAPTVAEIEAQRLPAYKAKRLAELRADAAALILAKWPAWAQSNCALGIYPEATAAQCSADIAAVVTASNAAEDAVTAATTVSEAEAVTATWPTL